MRIWRVEHRLSRKGPYDLGHAWGAVEHGWCFDQNSRQPAPASLVLERIPAPHKEEGYYDHTLLGEIEERDPYFLSYIFGFPTKASAVRWFTPRGLLFLASWDYVFSRYSVPVCHLIRHPTQVAFNRHEAERLYQVDLRVLAGQ